MGLYLRRKKHRSQRGDTIVEVLIALSVISLILVGAFVTSNRSAAATRDSQEHAEASQLLMSQIELVRTMVAGYTNDATDPLTTGASLFCIDLTKPATPTQLNFTNYPNGNKTLLPIAADDFSKYPSPGCTQSAAGYSYYVVIENSVTNPTDVAPNTLLFVARWDSGGGGRNQVSFTYRIHAIVAGTNGNPSGGGTLLPGQCAITGDPSLVRDGNFDQPITPATTTNISEAGGYPFTSLLPYRGQNQYPDDSGVNGQTPPQRGWDGGFSVFNNQPVQVSYRTPSTLANVGPPYLLWGVPLGVNTTNGETVKTYFYSNPVQSVLQPRGTYPSGGNSYKGPIWSESNIPVAAAKYEFEMWVSNIKLPNPGGGADPTIELVVKDASGAVIADYPGPGTTSGTGVDIQHGPDPTDKNSASTWEAKHVTFTSPTAQNLTLEIIDHTGLIQNDDFTMTGLGLYRCS